MEVSLMNANMLSPPEHSKVKSMASPVKVKKIYKSLVEAALDGDMESVKLALLQEKVEKKDAEGRDAILSAVAGRKILM